MKKIGLIVSVLLMTGCSSIYPRYNTPPVIIPCKVPSIEEPVFQQPSVEQLTLFEKVKGLLIELETRKAYEQQLKAAIKTCQ